MKRILVVDDDPHAAQLIGDCFKDLYPVDIATNGRDALTMVRQHRPSVVLLATMLRGVNSLQVLKEIKRSDSTIEVVMMTRGNNVALEVEALRSGAAGLLMSRYLDQ
jgi:DNA-binding response OmpR family regulator